MPRSPHRRPRTAAGSWFIGAVVALVLTGCSSSSFDSGGEPGAAAPDSAAGADLAGEGASIADGLTAPQANRMIAREASMYIAVDDVEAAAVQVRTAVTAAQGWVVSEELNPRTEGNEGWANLVVSVPSTALDPSMASLEGIGEVTARTVTSVDVTQDYVDVAARLETMESSVTRVRGLLEDATSIRDIVELETELASREADLDALKARLQSLESDVSHSTITVVLRESRDAIEAAAASDTDRRGFLWGLERGWQAFVSTGAAALTALGAALPFLGVAILVGVPLWAVRRNRGRSDQPGAAPSTSATTASGTASGTAAADPGSEAATHEGSPTEEGAPGPR